MSNTMRKTQFVLTNHLSAFLTGQGVDEIPADYDEQAIIYAPDLSYRCKVEFHSFFENLLANLRQGTVDHFLTHTQEINGDVAYMV